MTRPLKLFIGSGNLGNAEPDPSSIAAWIPDDGNCSEVVDNQKYPIVKRMEDFETAQQDDSDSSDHEKSPSESGRDFSSMRISRLKALCREQAIDTTGLLEKDEFIEALENYSGMNISQLKALCQQQAINTTGMLEKEEFIKALEQKSPSQKARSREQFDIIVIGMQESTFEPREPSEETLEEINSIIDDMDGGTEVDLLFDESEIAGGRERHFSCELTVGDDSVEHDSDSEDTNNGGNESADSDLVSSARSSKALTASIHSAAKHAGKVAMSASITAGNVAKTAGKTTGKAAKTAAKTAGKAAVTAGKTAGKAAVLTGKAAITSAEQVAKVGEKAADAVEKTARKGVGTVNMLTANREHKKDNAQLISDGTAVLHRLIYDRLPSYKRLLSFQRGEMRLLVYTLDKHHTVKMKSVRAQNTGFSGLANKGGIVAECIVGEGTIMSFMSCHLEAHEGISKYATRCSTLGLILKGTKKYAIPSIYPDASLASHYCFILGDLNFRTRYQGRIKSEDQSEDVTALVAEKNWKDLNEADELRMALEKQECLCGFQTLFCNFPPTFKIEREEGYRYKAQRTPSYTDRILWRTGDQLERKIRPLAYEPINKYATSDHKPIRGAFEVQLNRRVFLKERAALRSSVFPWRHHGNEDTPKHENLHFFVCDLQCDIFPNSEWSSKPPDSYVCLVSSPEDILLKKPTKMKQMKSVMKKFLRLQDVKVESEEYKQQHSHNDEWPRTGKIKNTMNPDWKNREIHCILKTDAEDGSPINLSGAILHIFVFKHNGRQMDEVIGSYPINLENVYRSCTLLGSHSMRHSWRKSKRRKSFSGLREPHENMVSLDINGPLLKNGRQTGVLRCTIDAWWINDALAQANGTKVDDPNDPSSSKDSMDASDSSHAKFSSRRRTPKQKKKESVPSIIPGFKFKSG